jgi:hypothetical protein
MTGRWWLLLLSLSGIVLLSACGSGGSRDSEPPGSTASPAADASSVAGCEPAPAWLVAVIQDGIVVRGATLSNMYVMQASGFTSGPAELQTDAFASAWWVAGKLSGAGVRPEIAVWLTNRTSENQDGQILAADAPARRYSEGGSTAEEAIRGAGLEDVRQCVGPIPEP